MTLGRTSHFEIYTNAGDETARSLAAGFERLHALFARQLGVTPRGAVRVVCFATQQEFDATIESADAVLFLIDVRSGLSVQSRRAIERGELDIALYKRDAGESGGIAAWPERLHWVTSREHPINFRRDPLPLVMSEQGCLYRNRMIHAAEAAGRAWHMAYTSPSLVGIQAALQVALFNTYGPYGFDLSNGLILTIGF